MHVRGITLEFVFQVLSTVATYFIFLFQLDMSDTTAKPTEWTAAIQRRFFSYFQEKSDLLD